MFDFVRSHRSWMMLFILVLILPSFVFFGIQGYNTFLDKEGGLATVDGAPVTQQEYDNALRDRVEQLRQRLGTNFDPKLLETPEARAAILDQLVFDRALANEAQKSNVVVTDDRLREVISAIPAFQEDGKYSHDRFKAFLVSRNQSQAAFEQSVRNDLRKQMFAQAVIESAMVPKQVIDRLDRILLEQREVRELRFPADQFASKVSVTEAQIAEYYQANRTQFEIPESVRVEYLVLSPETVGRGIDVSDEALTKFVQETYGDKAKQRSESREKALKLLAEVSTNPARLAELARAHSADSGSAANGGQLPPFGRGEMVKPFEAAAFALAPGQVSPKLVETEFGFHILRLDSRPSGADKEPRLVASHILIAAPNVKDLAGNRAAIETEYRNQQTQKRYTEASDQFNNLVYEQADSLQPAAQKFNLKVLSAENVTRRGLPPHLAPRVVEALFAEDSLKNRRNTQAIEVAPSTMVSARVVDYRPASVQPLDKVTLQIRQLLERRDAVRLAREAGEQRLAALRKDPSDTGFSAPKIVSRRQPQDLSSDALTEVLRTPADKLPQFIGTEVGTDFRSASSAGYVIMKVAAAKPGEPMAAAQREAQTRAIVAQAAAGAELTYAEGLKARHNVKILRSDLQRKAEEKPAAKAAADVGVKSTPSK